MSHTPIVSHTPREDSRQSMARIASYGTILVGLWIAMGWIFEISWLINIIPSTGATTKANTALCFILVGTSLALQSRPRNRSALTRMAQGCAIVASLIGLSTLMQYLFNWNLGIDELLVRDRSVPLSPYPGRMGDNTALCFTLTGLALWLNNHKHRRRDAVAQVATLCSMAIALLALVGYIYDVQVFYRFIFYSTSMSALAALTFVALGIGLLALQADRGYMKVLTSHWIGSITARKLMPFAIALPFILGWLILQGLRANLYDAAFSIALLVISLIFALVLVIWKNGQKLNQIDYDRKRSDDRLRSSEARLKLALEAAGQGIWDWNLDTNVLNWDEHCKTIFGLPPELPATYEWHLEAIHPEDRQRIANAATVALHEHKEFDEEYRTLHPDGTLHWVQARGQGYYDATGQPYRMLGVVLEITERKRTEVERERTQRNDQFLNDLDLRLRRLADASTMEWEVVQSLGKYLQADRCLWHEINWDKRSTTVEYTWRRNEAISDVTGTHALNEFFTPQQLERFAAGQTMVVEDVSTHPDTAPYAQNYLSFGVGAFVSVPCIQAGHWVAVLAVNAPTARHWQADEVLLLQETVARLWSMIEETRAIQALRESEERLRLALAATNQGWYDLNIQTGNTIVSPEYSRLLGYNPETFQETNATWRERLHPDDRDRVSQEYANYIAGERDHYRVEFRQQTQSGDWIWILSLGKIIDWDATGRPLRMLGTHTDITDRKRVEAELTQSNRLKDEFLAALSHELRTPLHLMLGWITILKGQKLSPEETQQALETIERNARQQMTLVNDMLDVSRTLQGRLLLTLQPVDLAWLLKDVIHNLSFAAEAKAITIEMHSLPTLNTIGDRNRLQQIFWNLLSNAIKFTPENGKVEINLAIVETVDKTCTAQIQIIDTGIGIPVQFLPHVFDYFRQADGGLRRKYNGLGLGLAIVRHLVELHGGTVQAESSGVDQGTTFTVMLPLLRKPQ